MNVWTKRIVAGLVAGSALVAAAAPAEAQRWRGGGFNRGWHGGGFGYRGGYRGYRGYRGNGAGVAIGAGLLGLGLGAAIASSNRGYYDRGYYGGGGYYGGPAYYGGGPGYYGDAYVEQCYTRRVWDPYIGRPVRVRYCD